MLREIQTGDLEGNPYLNTLIYGEAKTGKTTLASTFPSPLFITFSSEGGIDTLRGNKNVLGILQCDNFNDFKQATNFVTSSLKKKNSYSDAKTIVIDSLTTLWEVIVSSVLGLDAKGADTTTTLTWDQRSEATAELMKIIHLFKKISAKGDKHVVFVAHADEMQDNDTIITRIGVSSKRVSKRIAKDIDYIFNLGVPDGNHKLRMKASDKYQVGVRSPMGHEVPEALYNEDVSFKGIMDALGFSKPKAKKKKKK